MRAATVKAECRLLQETLALSRQQRAGAQPTLY